MSDSSIGLITWAVAELPIRGEIVSGDAAVVEVWPGGALVAAIDALGHGPEAEAAARAASDVLRSRPSDPPAILIEKCHQALRKTRGIAITLASYSARESSLTWIGIGNVEAVLFRADPAAKPPRESALLRGGIVGSQIALLRPTAVPIGPEDTLVMATDGVSSKFATVPCEPLPPQEISHRILQKHGKGTDDALVLVARFPGGRP
jgi:negative regulator of sigma-B (phosphoserine phosphatase)